MGLVPFQLKDNEVLILDEKFISKEFSRVKVKGPVQAIQVPWVAIRNFGTFTQLWAPGSQTGLPTNSFNPA